MKLVALQDVFDVVYGNKFDLCAMPLADAESHVNFVSRSAKNNGVSAVVGIVPAVAPYPAGRITVALGGAILASFVQQEPFYTAQNVAVLSPREPMQLAELLYYCAAIQHNRFRYSAFGREANRTLRALMVPARDCIPRWAGDVIGAEVLRCDAKLREQSAVVRRNEPGSQLSSESSLVAVRDLFAVEYGTSLELNALTADERGTAFVSRTTQNNGVSARVAPVPGVEPIQGGVLTVALGGSPLATFLQEAPFYSGRDVAYLRPKTSMSREVLLFYAACLEANKYRYSYGRQANRTLSSLMLPALSAVPEWVDGVLTSAAVRLRSHLQLDSATPFVAATETIGSSLVDKRSCLTLASEASSASKPPRTR